MIVLLDSGPLGPVTSLRMSAEAIRCNEWLKALFQDRDQGEDVVRR